MDGLPDIVGRQRDIQGGDSQGNQRVNCGVGNGSRSGYCASLTGSFHSEHVKRTWCLGQGKLEGRQLYGKGDSIVHQGCAEHLPTRVVGHLFIEGLTHALCNRSEEHTSELQSHSFISYAVFCLKKK